jgi:hypothetical protein
MSKKRSVDTHFWNDNYVAELDPIEKILFLYFLTNPLTNMLGVYEIPLRRIAFDTGIDADMVKKIIDRFDRDGKFSYVDGYLVVHKFLEHQRLNTNMKTSAENEFLALPDNVKRSNKLQRVLKALKGLGMLSKIEIESEIESEVELERERESEKKSETVPVRTRPPSVEDVKKFFLNNSSDEGEAEIFHAHYDSQGWEKQNGMAITSWQSLAIKWIKRNLHGHSSWSKNKKQTKKDAHAAFLEHLESEKGGF